MTRTFVLLLSTALALAAQPAGRFDLLRLTDELNAAVQAGDWAQAATLSRSLRSAVEDARNRSMAASGSELADLILNWLPADTETLLVAQEPFAITPGDQTEIPSALALARGYVLGLLRAAEKENLFKTVSGRTVRLAALGARRFGEEPLRDRQPNTPAPLGLIPYQGCAIYAFAAPTAEAILRRPPDDSIMGNHVWISQGSQNDLKDSETYFVSLVKPDLMMVCNNREFFTEMVVRMSLAPQPRALPASLAEWKQLDRTTPVWGVSHYGEHSKWVASLLPLNNGIVATGVIVEFGLAAGAVQARMISNSDPWKEFVKAPDFRGAAKSRESTSGVWELLVEGKPDAAAVAVLALMGMLGFVVLI